MLLVTHLAVQRCLYSYFTGTDAEAIPYLPLPAGAVLELTPTPHGTQVRTHILLPDDEEARTRRLRDSPPSSTRPAPRVHRTRKLEGKGSPVVGSRPARAAHRRMRREAIHALLALVSRRRPKGHSQLNIRVVLPALHMI